LALAVRQPVRDVLTPKVRAARRSGPKLKRFFWGARRFVGWGLPIGWLAASLAAGTAAVLELLPPGGCKADNASPCEMAVHLSATTLIASAGFFFFFFLQGNRVLKRYLERAAESPARLLQEAGAGSEDLVVDSRTETRDDVIDTVSGARRPEPILIVGDPGEGKTALLAAIAKELAKRSLPGYIGRWNLRRPFGPPAWRVPVGVSLRAGDVLDFEELARKSFIDQVVHGLNEPQRADAIWRKVKKSLGVVVLVDGIERVRHISRHVRDKRLGEAMAAAKQEKIAVVLTARTSDVPAVKARAFPLECFDTEEICKYLKARLRQRRGQDDADQDEETSAAVAAWKWAKKKLWRGRRSEAHEQADDEVDASARGLAARLESLATKARFDALRTPFYLDLVARTRLPPEFDSLAERGRWPLQRGLLKKYVATVAQDERMSNDAENRMVEALSELAPQMLVDDGELDPSKLRTPEGMLGKPGMLPSDRRQAIASAMDLALLERASSDDPIKFSDRALNAYFAALRCEKHDLEFPASRHDLEFPPSRRFEKAPQPLWKDVLHHAPSEEVMKALCMFAAAGSSQARARLVCEELLNMPGKGADAERDLRLARTAAEIANASELKDLYEDIAKAAGRTEAADRLQKLKLLRALGGLEDRSGYRTLFEYARAVGSIPKEWGDFVLRWAASKHLVEGRNAAYEAIAETVDAKITEAEESARSEGDCAVIGWLLPGMRLHDGNGCDEDIERQLKRLLALALDERFDATGMENALARGFKIDALSRSEPPVDSLVLDDFLPHARFWHARLCLVHAIAIPCFARKDARSMKRLQAIAAAVGRDGGHRLVRRAAELCLDGIDGGPDHRENYIWEAEGHATSQASWALTPKTAQLVADVAILMNLIYSKKADDSTWNPKVAVTNIPACLSTSHKRDLSKACHCGFELCPLPVSTPENMVRGEVSQAFCRRQIDIARSVGPPPWQERITASRLEAFWRKMESNAAKKPLLQWWETMSPPDGDERVTTADRRVTV